MPVQCETYSTDISRISEGGTPSNPEVADHVEECLRCQAELVQYRKLLRTLHQMRTEVLEPAPGLVTDVLTRIEHSAERRAIRSMITGRRVAYIGGIGLATAAAGAGAALVVARRGSLRKAS